MSEAVDLNRVAIFVRVVETGSFTAAATALGLPKSSVSRAVSQLEASLGARLLHRTTRKLNLTDAGFLFHERALAGIARIEEGVAAVGEKHGEPSGVVRLTAPVDAGMDLLPPVLTRFVRKHPKIHVEVSLTNRTVDLVGEGFDLALRAGRLKDSSLVARKINEESLALFAAPSYLKQRGTPRTLADLASHDVVLFRARGGRVRLTLDGPQGQEAVDVHGPLSSDDLAFVRSSAVQGAGIALLPRALVEGGGFRLERVLPKYEQRGAVFSVVYPSSRFLPQRVALLRDFLAAELGRIFTACRRASPRPSPGPRGT